jgi:hypothetical protein
MRIVPQTLFALVLCCCCPLAARAQQPFITDDADVTEKGRLHFEFSNEFDLLHGSAFPALRQNTTSFELAYGLVENLEVSVEAPLIAIFNARDAGSPRRVFGPGDVNLSVKYNFLKEREGSRRPALTASFSLETPTGNVEKGLGSGVADFTLNGVLQKTLTKRTTGRLNGGVIFSGNTLTGAVGLRTRGIVYTTGASLVRKFTPRLDLGAEVTGARASNFDLGKGLFQTQIGGNYALRENVTFDFGFIAGRAVASPRFGAQLGLSIDF